MQIDEFYTSRTGRLACYPIDYNGKIKWYKDGDLVDLDILNATLLDNSTTLSFNSLRKNIQDGHYYCENKLSNGQVVTSNTIKVNVNGKFEHIFCLNKEDQYLISHVCFLF